MRALLSLTLAFGYCSALRLEPQNSVQRSSTSGVESTTALVILHSKQIVNKSDDNEITIKIRNNDGYFHMLDCWLEHFLKQQSIQKVNIYTLDANSTEWMEKLKRKYSSASERMHHMVIGEEIEKKAQTKFQRLRSEAEVDEDFVRDQWPSLHYMHSFFYLIQERLKRGEHVIHADIDSVWVRDPWPVLENIIRENPDVAVLGSTDDDKLAKRGPMADAWGFNLNTGFLLYRNKPSTLRMVETLSEWTGFGSGGMPRDGIEQGNQNKYLVQQKCSWHNAKGEEWHAPTQTNKALLMTKSEFGEYERACATKYKNMVDKNGLIGECINEMKIAALDVKSFVRNTPIDVASAPDAVVVHPRLSFITRGFDKRTAYDLFKEKVPGVCTNH